MSFQVDEITKTGRLIEQVGTPKFPSTLIAFLKKIIPFDYFTALGFSHDTSPINLFHDLNDDSERQYLTHYFNGAYSLDPYYQLSFTNNDTGFVAIRDIAPDRFFKSEYFNSYYQYISLVDEIGFLSPVSKDWTLALSLSRTDGRTTFGAHEIKRLRRLEPILKPLITQHWGAIILRDSTSARLMNSKEMAPRIFNYVHTSHLGKITKRQSETAALILQGHSSYSIGKTLGIALSTVKVHRKALYTNLQISAQNELYIKLLPAIFDP